MVSKIEVLAYYLSLALNLYFVFATYENVSLSIEDLAGLIAAIGLTLLDVATLRGYFASEEGSKGTTSLQLSYIATTKIECYMLILLGTFFFLILADPLNITLAIADYLIINARVIIRFRSFAASDEYDARAVNVRENLMPFNLIFYLLVITVDIVLGVITLPYTLYKSVEALCTAPWLPDVPDDVMETPGAILQAIS